jgi:hypothetical protein
MKKLAFASLAALVLGAASLSTGASALPRTSGISAPNDAIVQVKHKKSKKSKMMDQNKDNSMPAADDKKAM